MNRSTRTLGSTVAGLLTAFLLCCFAAVATADPVALKAACKGVDLDGTYYDFTNVYPSADLGTPGFDNQGECVAWVNQNDVLYANPPEGTNLDHRFTIEFD